MSFACYLLAVHPEKQDRLYNEILKYGKDVEVKEKDEEEGKQSFDSFKEMPYLDAIIFETLRLFPPVPIDVKEATSDDVLPNGVKIGKGTVVVFEPYVMARNQDVYASPCSFQPERWLQKEDGKPRPFQTFDPYAFPVFQAGPRICLGKDLALFEVKFLLVELIKRYRLEFPDLSSIDTSPDADVAFRNGKPVYKPGLTMSYRGELNLRFHRRKSMKSNGPHCS